MILVEMSQGWGIEITKLIFYIKSPQSNISIIQFRIHMICEMFSYYKTQGLSLLDKLKELYKKYGYYLNTLHSFEFDGSAGMAKMADIMHKFHEKVGTGYTFANKKVEIVEDYSKGLNGLPKSDVLKYKLEGNCSVVVRPSGTEPKLKTYISISAPSRAATLAVEKQVVAELSEFFK